MANNTIEQLNFEVILNDKEFKKAIEADLKAAQELNTKLSKILDLKKQLNGQTTDQIVNAEKVRQAEEKTAQQVAKTAEAQERVRTQIEKTKNAQKGYSASVLQTREYLSSTEKIMRTISQLTGVAFSVVGLRRFLESLIDITGQFEVQRMALRNMLQDIDGADKIFDDLYRFASDSTYRFSELAKYAKQLSAFNIDQNNLLETTKMLGDVASGVGVSMDRLILAYGHVKSSGFLRGIQLRSFSQNGVPILDELAKMFSEVENRAVSLGEVFDKMTKREIPFEMVEEAFRRMTSEGGKFYQMQEVLSKTLAGQINILKGRWENLLAAMGQANSGVLKDAVSWMSNLVSSMDNFGRLIKQLIVGFSAYQVALIAAVGITKGFAAALDVGVLGSLKKVAVAIMANPFALLATAAAAASVVIYGLITAMSDVEKIQNSLTKSIGKFNDSLSSEIGELDALYAKLKLAREGTEEYDAAKQAIVTRFGPYIEQLRSEGVEVNNLATIYQNLATKIREANKEKFLESSLQDLSTQWSGAESNLRSRFNKTVSDMEQTLKQKLTAVQKESLWRFVTGTVTDDNRLIVDSVVSNLEHNLKHTQKYVNPKNATSGPHYMAAEQKQDASYLMKDIRGLAKDYQETSKAYADSVVSAHEAFDILERGANKAGEKQEDELVYRISSIVEGIKKADAEIEKIRKKARGGSITQAEKDELDALIKDRDAQAKEYEEIMGIKYDKDTRGVSRGESAAQKMINEKAAEIKSDIAILEKFKAAYDKLEPIIGEDAARAWVFNNMGHDVSNLDEEFEKLISDLAKLSDDSKRDADAIEARLGLDKASKAAKEYTEAQKALKEYERAFDKFNKDWGTGDTAGAANKAEGILRKYTNEKQKIEEDWGDLQKKAAKANKEVTQSEIELYEARKKANENTMIESLRGIVDDIFKEQFPGKELSDWSHKSLADIKGIKKTIESMKLPADIAAMVKEKGGEGALKELQKVFEEYKQNLIDGTVDPEFFKKMSKYAKQVASYISKAGAAMRKLGEATNDVKLSDAGDAVSAIGQNLSAAAEGYEKSGHWIGAVVGGVVDIFNQVTEAVANANAKMKEMEDTIRNIRIEAESARFDQMLSGDSDTVFGDNFIERVKDAVQALDGLRKVFDELEDSRRNAYAFIVSLQDKLDGTTEQYRKIIDANGMPTPGIGDMEFRTDHSFWSGDTFKRLSDLAAEFGMELEDTNHNLNPKLLQKVLDLYGDLNEGAKDWLSGAIQYSEEYEKALKQIEDATKDIFGNLASDMADKFIDNFLAMGNAVDDLSDTFADLGDAILRSFLQSYILDNILKNYEEQANDALTKYANKQMTPEQYAEWLDGFADNVQRESEAIAPAINSMIEAFKDRGLMNIDEDTSGSLGSGIKSITEDTANLLASYINAIRADVSYIRLMQERGWESINALGSSVPTLNEHLAQIAATNFDIAQSNQSILSELQSVIGAPGTSGMVVRVESY